MGTALTRARRRGEEIFSGRRELGLSVVIEAVVVTEQFHEAVLTVFETLLWWGTLYGGKPVADLVVGRGFP